MLGSQIRQTFLAFYQQRGHAILPSASLIPEDPTVLLTIAGMLPFKPIFLGQRPAPVPRATTAQKCIRTNDIENVGRTARHHTFFEMLGNFSFGDYFKAEAIAWAWELVTEVFGLPADRLVVSVFREDEEAFALWRDQVGIPAHRICRMGEADNFWAAGPTGPCGPCSEIYYDFHPEEGDSHLDLEDDRRFLEIYNLVFMEMNRDSQGVLTPLAKQNIDTGLGLERLAQVLQRVPNNYETDLIFPIIERTASLAGVEYARLDPEKQVSLKVIGDHVRAGMHLISDGVIPSNVGRGYVLRRLLRRVIYHGQLLGIGDPFLAEVVEVAIQLSEAAYPQVRQKAETIKLEMEREESQFLRTLERGRKLFTEVAVPGARVFSGKEAFRLQDTYGFPLELTQEMAAAAGMQVDVAAFEQEMAQQRQRSRDAQETVDVTAQGSLHDLAVEMGLTDFCGYDQLQATAEVVALWRGGERVSEVEAGETVQVVLNRTPFYGESGGQVGDRGFLLGTDTVVRIEDVQKESGVFVHLGRVERGVLRLGDRVTAQVDQACRWRARANHTATHLLQAALKQIVDAHISQAGSLVAFDRLRFDFYCSRPVTPEELQQIEQTINGWIWAAQDTTVMELPLAEAKARGAVAMFGEKYGEVVRVVDVPGVSMELCGGTHVRNTSEIGLFKIVSETGIAAGIRRIEAVAGPAALDYLNEREGVIRELMAQFKVKPQELPERIRSLQNELKASQKQVQELSQKLALSQAMTLLSQAETVGELRLLVADLGNTDPDSLKTAAEHLLNRLGAGVVILGSVPAEDKVSLVAALSPAAQQQGLHAGKLVGEIAKITGGGGGGRPHLAQAGGRDPAKLGEALAAAKAKVEALLGGSQPET